MSFYAKYWAADGGYLLGGIKQSQTSRFQLRADAELRLAGIVDVHPGRQIMHTIVESKMYPEIFYHCQDAHATCVGCKCSGCGKILTEEDAITAGGVR